MLKFFNTLSGQLEEFRPIREGEVRLYICGPTVWDYAHIGNFRTMAAFGDVLRRYLKYKGFQVRHVMNITDIEDRIIKFSREQGKTIDEYTSKFTEAFLEDFDALGAERPEVTPRATRHITEMVDIIKRLEAGGHAYRSDGSYYYRIASFPQYGKLSKINFAGNRLGGSERVDTDKYEKEDARDFALWKAQESPDEPAWETEIGAGRPGWHIECSAMSMKYLGETFDIHAGGIDLVFPHHENEIAQSEGATEKTFARYWIHYEHLKVDGESMSKSKGNYYTFRDVVALAALHNLAREVNTAIDCHALRADDQRELLSALERINSVLNIFDDEQPVMLDAEIQSLIDGRQEARRRRDFARADEIRDQLAERGITLEDTKDGVRWKRR